MYQVKNTSVLTYLDGIQGFSPAEFSSSPHGAQYRILQAVDSHLTYADLVCYSAFAFRVNAHSEMCPSAGHPFCGYVCWNNGWLAIPWNTKYYSSAPWDEPKEDPEAFKAEIYQAVKSSIDRGLPVRYVAEEEGLIIGYSDEGKRWYCLHPYHKQWDEPFWHDQGEGFAGGSWPWGFMVWLEPKPESTLPSDNDLTRAALQQAVDMWTADWVEEKYVSGDKAYEIWLSWLKDVEAGKVENFSGGMQGNSWYYDVLVQNRSIASGWLKGKAGKHPEKISNHLNQAAALYQELVDICMQDLTNPWDFTLHAGLADKWTSDLRIEQIRRLEKAHQLDAEAIVHLQLALNNWS